MAHMNSGWGYAFFSSLLINTTMCYRASLNPTLSFGDRICRRSDCVDAGRLPFERQTRRIKVIGGSIELRIFCVDPR